MLTFFSNNLWRASHLESRSIGKAAEESYDPNTLIYRSATREYRKSECKSTVDSSYVYYMDVGGWSLHSDGSASTTFGLISGSDVLICDWMNLNRDGTAFGKEKNVNKIQAKFECGPPIPMSVYWSSLAPGAKNFLEQALAQKRRGYILAAARARTASLFTNPNELILIIPDLHLRLRVDQPLDLFRYKKGDQLVSLDDELSSLLEVANKVSAITVQVGDMYETWETEALLRHHYHELLKWVDEWKKANPGPGWKLRPDLDYMVRNHRVFTHVVAKNFSWESWIQATREKQMAEDVWEDVSVAYADTESIEDQIRRQHRKLFWKGKSFADRLTQHDLVGNHDNNFANTFWSKTKWPSEEEVKNHPELSYTTKPSSKDKRYEHQHLGINNSIWIEHGHEYDIDNNNINPRDPDWCKPGKGFDIVRAGLVKAAQLTDSDWFVNFCRGGADIYADTMDKEMRNFLLIRADEIFCEPANRCPERCSCSVCAGMSKTKVHLVVTGHTHQACLLEIPRGTSLFWLHPHARHYYNSGNCMQRAKQIVHRRSEAQPTIKQG